MLDVPGICDRCGFRYRLKELRTLYNLNKPTNTLVCPDCWEASHPQLDTRTVKTVDRQFVPNSRSDLPERRDSRDLWGWNPVGMETTNTITCEVGIVRVTVT